MPNAVHARNRQWHALAAQQPAERTIFMTLGEAFHRRLVKPDIAAIAHCPADITMGNLQRPGGTRRMKGNEFRGVDVQHLLFAGSRFQHRIIFFQQIGAVLIFGEHQRVASTLQ